METESPSPSSGLERRIEKLNALLLVTSFLLATHKSEHAFILRALCAIAALLSFAILVGYDYDLLGRVALFGALATAAWLCLRAVRTRRAIESAREELRRHAQAMRDLGVPLPPLDDLREARGHPD